MLEINKLSVKYNGIPVLKDVGLRLEKGQTLSLVGESGAGKTTLGLAIMGLAEGDCTGEIFFQGQNMIALGEEERRSIRGLKIAMVFQNAENALHPLYTVQDQIMEAILVHGHLDKNSAACRVAHLLALVGLEQRQAVAFPHQLSGGEKQRVLIAMALINDPQLLILDEPTAALDALTKADITKMLSRMGTNITMLVITHDFFTAARLTEKMAVLYGGRIVEYGNTSDLMSSPRHPYTRGLLRSYPNMTTTKDLQGIPGQMSHQVEGCSFHTRCTQKISICSQEVPPMVDVGNRQLACHRGGIVPFLIGRGMTKKYSGIPVVNNIDFTVFEGETLCVIGESGSGKTTLARMIMGLTKSDQGELILDGEKIETRSDKFFHLMQMVFQNPHDSISHRMTVFEAVKEPLDLLKKCGKKEKKDRVKNVLRDVELPDDDIFLEKYPHHLSGGEAQRVALARALVLNPKMLIADEPTSALDTSVQAKIMKLLLDLQEKRGLALFLITHDIALARKVSDRVLVMLRGSIVEEGIASQVISDPLHPYTKCLVAAAPGLSSGWNAEHQASCRQEGQNLVHTKKGSAAGCPFNGRCSLTKSCCFETRPEMIKDHKRGVACFAVASGKCI